MNRLPNQSPPGSLGVNNPTLAGTAYCIISALGYTGTNICMRQLSALEADPMWVIFNKELVTVVVAGSWLCWRALRGRAVSLPRRTLTLLVLVGLAVQLGANLGFQWALGIVGLALVVPTCFAVMLTTSALLGRVLLGERVSRQSLVAIGLLLASLALLGLAAAAAGASTGVGSTALWVALGVATACGAGAIYAMLMTTVRHTVTSATPISAIVFTTTSMAVLTLGPWNVYRHGLQQLLATPTEQLSWMLAAGTLNLIGFLAISKGLESTSVVHVNVLNATQVAMAAIAGMLLFRETATPWLVAGVALMIVGVVLIGRPNHADRLADQRA
jgi:DME family drug/metabolite transporter